MARLTPMTLAEAQRIGALFGQDINALTPIVHGSVNSNFRAELSNGEPIFLRVCEESDFDAVVQQNRLLAHFVSHLVPTPAPMMRADGRGSVALHQNKPVAVFPFVPGTWCCQRSCTPERLRQVGEALGRIHLAGELFDNAPPSRFGHVQLRARLDGLDVGALSPELRAHCSRLSATLNALQSRPKAPRAAVIHGDIFRDNVLWHDDGTLAAVLDFESASSGNPAFDLMVTLLAWCYGDTLEQPLATALIDGYRAHSPLEPAMLSQCFDEARAAAVRFAITRITDYELRPRGVVAYKDYQRFIARLDALERIGRAHFADWLVG